MIVGMGIFSGLSALAELRTGTKLPVSLEKFPAWR
jgi:hypothetical protein